MKRQIFVYVVGIALGLSLINHFGFAQDFHTAIRELLDMPDTFLDKGIAVEGRLVFIPTKASPYGEFVLADKNGNWIHVEPWLPKGPRIRPGQRAFGKGETMAHKVGKRFLIRGELKANVEFAPLRNLDATEETVDEEELDFQESNADIKNPPLRPKRGVSGTHYLVVRFAQEIQE